ncbi:hypothetical protein Z948_378 [Sulfitobacter donghicola DSW-25 = KCTC 12864 = JCM 14565]|nr:hypothetical protein Z948_378 [Sulfitobacter donghicola DSW-25 = KCTC 12864 = JCM 14565]
MSYYDDLVQAGVWLPTGDTEQIKPASFLCLNSDQSEKFDGAGIAGFGDEILQILKGADAWFATYGGVEGRKLVLYAPDARLAVWVRFGD